MMKIYRGSCLTKIPHPGLSADQFSDQQLINNFFDYKKERGAGVDKWFYFYCNHVPVRDPVVIEIYKDRNRLWPGLKRFIGTALREEQQLAAWIVTDQEQHTLAGIERFELVYEGPNWQKWIDAQKTTEFTHEEVRNWIRQNVRYRWNLELPDGRIFVLNPYAQEVAGTYKVSDLGLIGALKQMYQDCCEKATFAGTPICSKKTTEILVDATSS
jgi:hypothetical protein